MFKKVLFIAFLVTAAASCGTEIDELGDDQAELRRDCGRGRDWSYVSRSPEQCAATTFLCAATMKPFFNACGCGCTTQISVCDDPARTYVSHDPEQCATIRFFCESGVAFFDECGCGCVN